MTEEDCFRHSRGDLALTFMAELDDIQTVEQGCAGPKAAMKFVKSVRFVFHGEMPGAYPSQADNKWYKNDCCGERCLTSDEVKLAACGVSVPVVGKRRRGDRSQTKSNKTTQHRDLVLPMYQCLSAC